MQWNVTAADSQTIKVQLNFSEPLYISYNGIQVSSQENYGVGLAKSDFCQ